MGVTIRPVIAALIGSVAVGLACAPGAGAASYARGLDVSHWNGAVDWIQVVSGGYTFLFAKATEGTTLTDATYAINRAGTEGIGMRFGAYHFARPGGSGAAGIVANAIAQADYFVNVAQPAAGDLPPVLDLETKGTLSPTALANWTQAWLGEVQARTGVSGLIYASPSFWKSAVGDTSTFATAGNRLWIAHWTKNAAPTVPAANWGGFGWTFWQWTDCEKIPGFLHCVDGDRLNGTNPTTFTIAKYPAGVPVAATPPTVTGTAARGSVLAGVPGTWSGGKPVAFTYQWQRCDAAGAGCVPIAGATLESYTPAAADVGHALVLSVTATTAKGTATAPSPATPAVVPAAGSVATKPAVIAAPAVSGLAQAGQTLTAFAGTWSGAPSSFAYVWRRCDATGTVCAPIAAATVSSYTLTPDDIGTTLSLVVTATGAGGSTSVTTAATGVVVAAPLPQVSIGAQTAKRAVAGNLQTADGRAVVTWQPGAVHVGRVVHLDTFTGSLSVPGSEVALSVPGLKRGFKWPLDLELTQQQPASTVLGYSTNGKVYNPVPLLQPAVLPPGTTIGWYVDSNNLTHVLTRTPLQLALFKKGAWGDPSYTSANGPALARQVPLEVVAHPSDRSILLLTQIGVHAQARISASVLGAGGRIVPILGSGSRLGVRLRPGTYRLAQAYRPRPGTMAVRLRLNARGWRPGPYRLRVVALDPWGRRSVLTLPFRYP